MSNCQCKRSFSRSSSGIIFSSLSDLDISSLDFRSYSTLEEQVNFLPTTILQLQEHVGKNKNKKEMRKKRKRWRRWYWSTEQSGVWGFKSWLLTTMETPFLFTVSARLRSRFRRWNINCSGIRDVGGMTGQVRQWHRHSHKEDCLQFRVSYLL